MLWQGCSLSPRELERKAPRSVWATELPASRPIRWIVRESREANRTDIRPLLDNLNANSTTIQPLPNPAPTIGSLNPPTTDLQPPRNRESITTTPQSFPNNNPAVRSRQTDNPALGKHPRLNHPPCRIQERFRLNHPTSVILCSRVTFVIFSEAPRPAPSKNRQAHARNTPSLPLSQSEIQDSKIRLCSPRHCHHSSSIKGKLSISHRPCHGVGPSALHGNFILFRYDDNALSSIRIFFNEQFEYSSEIIKLSILK